MTSFYVFTLLLYSIGIGLAGFHVGATPVYLTFEDSGSHANTINSDTSGLHPRLSIFERNTASCDVSVDSKSKDKFFAYGKRKDVELLYLRIVFLNESNEPLFGSDITSVYDPLGWVWTDSEQGIAILSLPYDHKILSCTTLSRETRRLAFHIVSRPPDCFGKQSPERQFDYLVNLLSKTAAGLSENSSVCHRFVEKQAKDTKVIYQSMTPTGLPRIRYKCCQASGPNRDCAMKITSPNKALSFILTILWLVSCVAAFLTPLLITYLPRGMHDNPAGPTEADGGDDARNEDNSGTAEETRLEPIVALGEAPVRKPDQDEYINLNSSTPLGHLLEANWCLCVCPNFCPRLSRFLLFFILMPIVLIITLITYSIVVKHEITLQKSTGIKTDFIQMCLNPDPFMVSRIVGYIFSCMLLCIPLSLSAVVDESVLLVGNLQVEDSCCIICAALQRPPKKELTGHQLLYDNMLAHLKFLFSLRFWKVLFSLSALPSRWLLHFFLYGKGMSLAQPWKIGETTAYCVGHLSCLGFISTFFWILISPFWLIAFLCIACFIFFLMSPIGYFFSCICFVPLVFLVQKLGNNIFTWIVFLLCLSINTLSALFLLEMITFTWVFILKLLGFTLMGLVVGIDYYIPYIVYTVAVFFYIENFWRKLNDKYLKLKVLLFDECVKQHTILLEKQGKAEGQEIVIKHNKTELPMIPKQLYQIVCKEHMPFWKTVSSSLFNLLIIIFFLSFAFASIMAFGKWAKLPSLTEAIVTAFLSTLPKLLRYQGKHAGKSTVKEKKLLYSLEVNVAQFARQLKG